MMCSHATMGLGRYAVDHGIVTVVSPETVVKIESPCGILTANVQCEGGKSGAVRVKSSPCFVSATDLTINLGTVQVLIFMGFKFLWIFLFAKITNFIYIVF